MDEQASQISSPIRRSNSKRSKVKRSRDAATARWENYKIHFLRMHGFFSCLKVKFPYLFQKMKIGPLILPVPYLTFKAREKKCSNIPIFKKKKRSTCPNDFFPYTIIVRINDVEDPLHAMLMN